jgi:large subunit ribosomal protein L7/L12
MAKLSVGDILDGIKELSVIEAAELSKKIEEEFGIQAAAPVMAGVAPGAASGGAAAEEEAEEKTEFDVTLTAAGDKKIQVIKEVRALVSGLGLKEAKDLVDNAPKPVLEHVTKEAAQAAKDKLEAVGATVEVK